MSTKSKRKPGEAIPMNWCGCDPEYYILRGHVSEDEALEGFGLEYGEGVMKPPFYHLWARNLLAPHTDEFDFEIRLYEEKSQGTYPVTAWFPEDSFSAKRLI